MELNWKTNWAISFKHMLTHKTQHRTSEAAPLSLSRCLYKEERRGGAVPLFTPQSLLVSLWCLHSLPGAWSCLSPRVLASPDVRGWVTQYITSLHHQHCVHTRLRLTAYYLGWSNVTPTAAHKQQEPMAIANHMMTNKLESSLNEQSVQ